MKQFFLLAAALILSIWNASAFTAGSSFAGNRLPSSIRSGQNRRYGVSNRSRLNMFFGAPKDDGSPGDYVCKDCGYIFTKGPAAWAKLDNDKYSCPPCGAPKFRFKKVPKGSASGKVEVKKSWF
mmetsp:Transcript_88/g.228  ORF Transcript_88/g.228 Transcript_88/m.228 type:complete len:124 (+) Transcript_88:67-438(+)|eukprot:CAMPEP_0195517434 /NCGR_PEP_ID=MMETSP0794_2-20130614/10814_1 /TAXON_ID=515487 /ORGANISM="Stephanopyxis turris, Strain CCMP 815" /LENGTH=123 /DNA_ID=CAMNT_0040646245 /DNA_START=66 /DNA_END=437 /DNA_ORIENTATION=+